jgi:hypothetical protein
LLCFAESADVASIRQAAVDLNIPLDIVNLFDQSLRDIYKANLALIRPDQVVVWRGDTVPTDPKRLLEIVAVGRI